MAFKAFEKSIFADNCFFMFFNTLRKTRFDQIRCLDGKLDDRYVVQLACAGKDFFLLGIRQLFCPGNADKRLRAPGRFIHTPEIFNRTRLCIFCYRFYHNYSEPMDKDSQKNGIDNRRKFFGLLPYYDSIFNIIFHRQQNFFPPTIQQYCLLRLLLYYILMFKTLLAK